MYAPIGSISTGTLRPQDLARAYIDALKLLTMRDEEDPARRQSTIGALEDATRQLAVDDEEPLVEFVNEQAPALFDAYCAPFTYFGAHPGDGADVGVWPDIDALEQAARWGEGVVKLDAGDTWPALPEDIDYVYEVNDHGNVTLFDARSRKPLWGCV